MIVFLRQLLMTPSPQDFHSSFLFFFKIQTVRSSESTKSSTSQNSINFFVFHYLPLYLLMILNRLSNWGAGFNLFMIKWKCYTSQDLFILISSKFIFILDKPSNKMKNKAQVRLGCLPQYLQPPNNNCFASSALISKPHKSLFFDDSELARLLKRGKGFSKITQQKLLETANLLPKSKSFHEEINSSKPNKRSFTPFTSYTFKQDERKQKNKPYTRYIPLNNSAELVGKKCLAPSPQEKSKNLKMLNNRWKVFKTKKPKHYEKKQWFGSLKQRFFMTPETLILKNTSNAQFLASRQIFNKNLALEKKKKLSLQRNENKFPPKKKQKKEIHQSVVNSHTLPESSFNTNISPWNDSEQNKIDRNSNYSLEQDDIL